MIIADWKIMHRTKVCVNKFLTKQTNWKSNENKKKKAKAKTYQLYIAKEIDYTDSLKKKSNLSFEISKSNSMLERNKEQNREPVLCHDVNSELVPITNTMCDPDLHISVKL